MAEAMFRQRAILSGAPLRVDSAGFATQGEAPPEATQATMRTLGFDLSSHRSRLVAPEMLEVSDLIIGMTRAHVWEAAVMVPDIIPKSFVFGELDRLNGEVGGRRVGEPLREWLDRLHEHRSDEGHSARGGDEIFDPFGRRKRSHRKVAQRIQDLVLDLGDCAFDTKHPLSDTRWREGRLVWRPNEDGGFETYA
jgi:protein-tyrosine-phosphatase